MFACSISFWLSVTWSSAGLISPGVALPVAAVAGDKLDIIFDNEYGNLWPEIFRRCAIGAIFNNQGILPTAQNRIHPIVCSA